MTTSSSIIPEDYKGSANSTCELLSFPRRLNTMICNREIILSITYAALPNTVKTMLNTSIAFCEQLLRHNDTFYPFAAVDLNGDLQAVLISSLQDTSSEDDLPVEPSCLVDTSTDITASLGMLEQLEQQVRSRTAHVHNANSVICYMAFVEAKYGVFTDVVVADVTLYSGTSEQYYFPVTYLPGHVTIGHAFTMHTVK